MVLFSNRAAVSLKGLALVAMLLAVLATVLPNQANAQTEPQRSVQAAAGSSLPQKALERIRTEDAGARIDEVRIGGETQSITVQPKTGNNLPAYEVLPQSNGKSLTLGTAAGGATGARVWNVLKF